MMRYEELDLTRDCEAVEIPRGTVVTLAAETPVVITQACGDTYTIQVPTLGGLFRIAGKDADALGKTRPRAALDAAAALAGAGQPITEDVVLEALKDVYDPEIPVNIVDLGLIYDLAVTPRAAGGSDVQVHMTLTAPGCGMGQIIATDVKSRLEQLPGVVEAAVEVVWEPPWTPQRISPAGRTKLGIHDRW
jgi:probable FeS assembly SUF system protein SufT